MPVKKLNGYPLKKPLFSNELTLGDRLWFRNRVSFWNSRYCNQSYLRNPVSWFVAKRRSLFGFRNRVSFFKSRYYCKNRRRNPVSWFLCRYLRYIHSIFAKIYHIFPKQWRQFKQNFIRLNLCDYISVL